MKKWVKTIIIVFVLIIIFGGLGGIAYYRYQDKITLLMKNPGEELDIATPVAVYKVKRGTISESLVLNGEVVPRTEVNIYSTVPGKVTKIHFREGERVKKGDVLAHIDRSEAGLTFSPTPVESTIEGIVKDGLIELGDYITPQLPLFQIIDIDYVEVVVNVPEKDIARIRKGLLTEIIFISYPERIFYGRVNEISPTVDSVSRTLETRILIDNSSMILKPGMFGEVKIILQRKKSVLIIPLAAIIERDGRNIVFIENEGKAVEIEPVFDIKEGDRISVIKGLLPEQNVIVVGQHNVATGDKVNITEEIE
jgi:multidrug efflux pump subunit AcrA (membrane-fusion protein)